MTSKACKRCTNVKPLTDFHADRTARDGRQHYCKSCRSASFRPKTKRKRNVPAPKPYVAPEPVMGGVPALNLGTLRWAV